MPTPQPTVTYCGVDAPDRASVADAMLHRPRIYPASMSVAQAREALTDDHVHALPIMAAGLLLAVVERSDLDGAAGQDRAWAHGRLAGRVVGPAVDLLTTWLTMKLARRRRLAVVDGQGDLLGLLCLKRSGRGFCSQSDVDAHACAIREAPHGARDNEPQWPSVHGANGPPKAPDRGFAGSRQSSRIEQSASWTA